MSRCRRRSKFGACDRPKGHTDSHGVFIGGGSDPLTDPAVWFLWGRGVTPGYQAARLTPILTGASA